MYIYVYINNVYITDDCLLIHRLDTCNIHDKSLSQPRGSQSHIHTHTLTRTHVPTHNQYIFNKHKCADFCIKTSHIMVSLSLSLALRHKNTLPRCFSFLLQRCTPPCLTCSSALLVFNVSLPLLLSLSLCCFLSRLLPATVEK